MISDKEGTCGNPAVITLTQGKPKFTNGVPGKSGGICLNLGMTNDADLQG